MKKMIKTERDIMKERNSYAQNGGNSSFWLGFILGVLLTLLLTTKRGREVLRDLLDRGIQKISDLEDSLEKARERQTQPSFQSPESDYVPSPVSTVKEEIRAAMADIVAKKSVVKEPEIVKEEKQANEKGGKQELAQKTSEEVPQATPAPVKRKRLFFRRGQKKS